MNYLISDVKNMFCQQRRMFLTSLTIDIESSNYFCKNGQR